MLRPLLAALILASTGCAIPFGAGIPSTLPRSAVLSSEEDRRSCSRAAPSEELRMPLALEEEDPELAQELDALPPNVRRTALAAGLEPILSRMLRDRNASRANEPDFVRRRQAVAMQLVALSSQLEAAIYSADCLGDSAESVRHGIEAHSSAREIKRTVASIVVGAVAAVGAGIWDLTRDDSGGSIGIGIAGGVASGALGLAAFVHRETPIALDHPRNFLAPIFKGEDPSSILPTFVMRMLTLPDPSGTTPRDALLAHFEEIIEASIDEDERERARDLFASDGGIYTLELLHVREQMLDETESTLSAFVRDLELLQRWLGRAFDDGLLNGD